ncbi:MAG: outer membrane lipid asymmetry maintenance protein MlaD [Nitrospirales bacterium]|nr:outer membrane lipid asymmetry maintenance protein MlaD [Nitrospirales bacterium]
MKRFDLELAVGLFLIMGIIALGYISVKMGKMELLEGNGYRVQARFENAGGIGIGSVVEIAGVGVGKVTSVRLSKEYQAVVDIFIKEGVSIQEDSIASVKTKGLIGEKFIKITPGGSEKILADGGKIMETESALDPEELISKYIFGKV